MTATSTSTQFLPPKFYFYWVSMTCPFWLHFQRSIRAVSTMLRLKGMRRRTEREEVLGKESHCPLALSPCGLADLSQTLLRHENDRLVLHRAPQRGKQGASRERCQRELKRRYVKSLAVFSCVTSSVCPDSKNVHSRRIFLNNIGLTYSKHKIPLLQMSNQWHCGFEMDRTH